VRGVILMAAWERWLNLLASNGLRASPFPDPAFLSILLSAAQRARLNVPCIRFQ